MGIGRFLGWTTVVLVAASVAGAYVGWDEISAVIDREPVLSGVRKPLFPEGATNTRTSTVTATADDAQLAEPRRPPAGDAFNLAAVGPLPGVTARPGTLEPPPVELQHAAIETPPPEGASALPSDADEDGDVTPTLEGRLKRQAGKRGIVILQIGDSHTSADFLTGELRRRLQARYGRGAPGYITAGHPHIGVRSSSLKITASPGWTYKSLQKVDAVSSEFWLSGYNAIATASGETMSFANDKPVNFEMIEIEVLRQPGGGKIDVKLDGVVETTYDLASAKAEPVVIRLLPTRGATEKVREISITTTGRGPVSIASVAIYNKQSGITFNSIGYPGAQASFVNKFNNKLFANDLIRINPQIVILSFGTNEASNESLDLNNYRNSYERIVDKIKSTLPEAAIVVIGPPDFAELSPACRKEKDKAAQATCGRAPAQANAANGTNGTSGAAECAWRTPARLNHIREVQRDIANRQGLVYWNWASIMPQECGAHRWYTASPQLMAKDHVHFTIEGYKRSAEQFLNTLIPVIEKVRVGANVVSNN
jgi:lysophospholipase L1-like esterase